MEDITKDLGGIYESVCVCENSKQCGINQNVRNKALNNEFFQDDTGFDNWRIHDAKHLNGTVQLCLCGMVLTAKVWIVKRGNVKCYIGDSCCKKYKNLKEQISKLMRLTYDCEKCNKRIKKDIDTHGICLDCEITIDCKWKRCYQCNSRWYNRQYLHQNGGFCKVCGTGLDADWKTMCGRCWHLAN